jgi:hypothetical protein
MLTPSIYIFFAGQYGTSPVIHLNELTDQTDLFQSLELDEFVFTIPDTGIVNLIIIEKRLLFVQTILAKYNAYLEYGRSCFVDM